MVRRTYYAHINKMMELGVIRHFRDGRAERIFKREQVRNLPPEVQPTARRKLVELNNAISLDVLRAVPGNHLEALKGDRKGQFSIRINRQWRICFRWENEDAYDVEITDYH